MNGLEFRQLQRQDSSLARIPTVVITAFDSLGEQIVPEPDAWLIDKTDPIGNRQGAPGLWIGLILGLSVAAVLLALRLWRQLHPLPRAGVT